jgi:hypothetical protein
MGEACSAHGEMSYSFRILISKPEWKRQLDRSRHRWDDTLCFKDIIQVLSENKHSD